MRSRFLAAALGLSTVLAYGAPAQAQTVAELQKQIDELKALIKAQGAPRVVTKTVDRSGRVVKTVHTEAPLLPAAAPAPKKLTSAEHAALHPFLLERPETWADALWPPEPTLLEDNRNAKPKTWFERLSIRGYSQLRGNEFISGDVRAPAGQPRLRNVNDGGVTEFNNFTFRRVRVIIQGDIHERLFLYIQPDFATAVNNQVVSNQPRQSFGQLRDAFVDVFADDERRVKFRFGQQKVPYGWENLQSSQNRIPLDRTDAINSGIPSERDIGVTAFYTPWYVQAVWDRLAKDGQKLFGNYGAFALGAYNGQQINRVEQNNDLMVAGMVTWPFELDGLGPIFQGQVLELGASGYRNEIAVETSAIAAIPGSVNGLSRGLADNRLGLHAILYPQPFGIQAEYTFGEGPRFNNATNQIEVRPLSGGYVMLNAKVDHTPIGAMWPYIRYQSYDGGWKANPFSPALTTDDVEFGVEFQPIKALELTLAYSKSRRREADVQRPGFAQGDLFRAQLQWNY